ncbi:MAG: TIGR00295 family protein [Candidatus Bathyarchaeota archaeon]|nr:TIGR00295 family protein [Candidatus Bathyarchaeota archaeon]
MMRDAGCSRSVIDHCKNVTRLAMRIADAFKRRGFNVDLALVEAGALMHDLGRSSTHGVEHGAVGGELARRMSLTEPLARIIERHVGAGITEEEAERIGLSGGSYVPETLEEKIVAYADKLIEGNRQVDIEVTVEKFARELGGDHPALDRLRALHEEVVSLIGPEF